jgi:SAM-dependent methyltransferase
MLRRKIAPSIIVARLGYHIGKLSVLRKLAGTIISCVPLVNDIGESYVMFLKSDKGGKLLDVGCGNGQFLHRMKSLAWQVSGVEPVEAGVKAAKERYGIDVFNGTLEQAQFPSESFDVITLSHVIEHVPDPLALLRECSRLLRPCGKVIITTPNSESLGRMIFKRAWREWDPPRHFFLLSCQRMRSLAELSELEITVLRTTSCPAAQMWLISKSIRLNGTWLGGKFAIGTLIEGAAFWVLEDIIRLFWKKAGEELLVIANKT